MFQMKFFRLLCRVKLESCLFHSNHHNQCILYNIYICNVIPKQEIVFIEFINHVRPNLCTNMLSLLHTKPKLVQPMFHSELNLYPYVFLVNLG